MCLAIVCCSSPFFAPTTLSTSFPSFRNTKVGIASTAQSFATDCHKKITHKCVHIQITESIPSYAGSILHDRETNFRNFIVTSSSSTSTLRKVTVGSFLANSDRNGAMKRHGPHQEAVKSTTICISKRDEYMPEEILLEQN